MKSGDLYIEGSEKYADYREQLISWEEYSQGIEELCEQVGLPVEKAALIERVQSEMMNTARATDASFPKNEYLRIENGEAVLTPLKKQAVSGRVKRFRKVHKREPGANQHPGYVGRHRILVELDSIFWPNLRPRCHIGRSC